jgi:hypothetical protein
MIEEETARNLHDAARRFSKADEELRAGRSQQRAGVVALATEYVQARRALDRLVEEAGREEQTLEEGQ